MATRTRLNSNAKGKRGELEIANKLKKEHGYRTRRSVQYSGTGASENNNADVIGLPKIHMEVKWVERLNLNVAMEQAVRDSEGSGNFPSVFHKRNNQPWLVTMAFHDWVELYNAYHDYVLKEERGSNE